MEQTHIYSLRKIFSKGEIKYFLSCYDTYRNLLEGKASNNEKKRIGWKKVQMLYNASIEDKRTVMQLMNLYRNVKKKMTRILNANFDNPGLDFLRKHNLLTSAGNLIVNNATYDILTRCKFTGRLETDILRRNENENNLEINEDYPEINENNSESNENYSESIENNAENVNKTIIIKVEPQDDSDSVEMLNLEKSASKDNTDSTTALNHDSGSRDLCEGAYIPEINPENTTVTDPPFSFSNYEARKKKRTTTPPSARAAEALIQQSTKRKEAIVEEHQLNMKCKSAEHEERLKIMKAEYEINLKRYDLEEELLKTKIKVMEAKIKCSKAKTEFFQSLEKRLNENKSASLNIKFEKE